MANRKTRQVIDRFKMPKTLSDLKTIEDCRRYLMKREIDRGCTVDQAARNIGITAKTVYNWIQKWSL